MKPQKSKSSLAFENWDYLIVNFLMILLSYALFKGLTLPILEFSQFSFFSNQFSVVGGINILRENDQWMLYLVVLFFSVIFPILKLVLLFFIWNSSISEIKVKFLHFMVIVSKWSMLDVFIVAILVAWVKIDMVANVITHAGLNYFIISVVALSLIKNYVHWRLKKSLLQINKS